MISPRPKPSSFLLLVGLALWPGRAGAGEAAAAEALFLEGKALIERGEVSLACAKFDESQRLEPSSGTLLNLAACHERLGKVATAWAEYRGAERFARQQGKAGRVAEARRKAEELAPRLSYLTIRVASAVPGLEVKRDETRIESGGFGSPLPTDPGAHRVSASAPGHAPVSFNVTLGGAGDRKEVTIPALAPLPPSNPPAERAEVAPPAAERRPDPTLGFAIGGAGLGVAAVSGVFFLLALSADGSARGECPRAYDCNDEALDDESRRDTFATVATAGGIAGAAAIGVGAYLLLRPASDAPSATAPRAALAPRVSRGGGGIVFEGVF